MDGLLAARVNGQESQLGAVVGPLVYYVKAEVEKFGRLVAVVAVGVFVIGHIEGGIGHSVHLSGG